MRTIARVILLTGALVATTAAMAQSTYKTASAVAGKQTRLWTLSAIKKDCSIGQIGGVKIVTPPKNGTLTLGRGKVKSPASFRCPNLETAVEFVVYESKPKFSGTDEVSFETKNADGVVEKHTIRIEVSDKPAAGGKKDDAVNL